MPQPPSHQTVRLGRGRHISPQDGVCVMELASMLSGGPFTDHPASVCRVVAAVLRGCNDRFDDETRQRLYRYAAEAVGTAGDPAATRARVERCAEAVRGRTRPRGLPRLLRKPLVPPADVLGRGLESFLSEVVACFPRTPAGADALLALVDELLATPAARAPERRVLAVSGPLGVATRQAFWDAIEAGAPEIRIEVGADTVLDPAALHELEGFATAGHELGRTIVIHCD